MKARSSENSSWPDWQPKRFAANGEDVFKFVVRHGRLWLQLEAKNADAGLVVHPAKLFVPITSKPTDATSSASRLRPVGSGVIGPATATGTTWTTTTASAAPRSPPGPHGPPKPPKSARISTSTASTAATALRRGRSGKPLRRRRHQFDCAEAVLNNVLQKFFSIVRARRRSVTISDCGLICTPLRSRVGFRCQQACGQERSGGRSQLSRGRVRVSFMCFPLQTKRSEI